LCRNKSMLNSILPNNQHASLLNNILILGFDHIFAEV
jgi:hypothetical protein